MVRVYRPGPNKSRACPVHEKDSLLGFVYNQLRSQCEILIGVFPDKCLVITFVFDDADYVGHSFPSLVFNVLFYNPDKLKKQFLFLKSMNCVFMLFFFHN